MKQAIAAALLLGCLASCSPSSPEFKTQAHTDTESGFQLLYPDGWEKLKSGGSAKAVFNGGRRNRQITVSCEKGGEKEIADMLSGWRKHLPGYKELKGDWVKVKGRRAYFHTVCWHGPIGKSKGVRLYVPAGDHFFVVSGMTPLDEFDRYASILEECVLSFEVTKK